MDASIRSAAFLLALTCSVSAGADPFNDLNSTVGGSSGKSKDPRIIEFLNSDTARLTDTFPYRINIFKQGSTAQNSAGVRVSETASQLKANDSGLVFFYELVPSAMRVPHWHANAMELGTVLSGKIRVTIWAGSGSPIIYTVSKGQTWIIPRATLHALENIGNDKTEFLVAYDSPVAADRDFVTAWASLPDPMLARSIGLTEADIAHIKKTTVNRLSNYEPDLKAERRDVANKLSNDLEKIAPLFNSRDGNIVRLDPKANPLLNDMILQRTTLKPGSMRVPHWYTNGDVLLFVTNGLGYISLMDDDGHVYRAVVNRGDLVSIPEGNFHGILNVGDEELRYFEVFNRARYTSEITLMNGAKNMGADVIRGTTGISKEAADKLMKTRPLALIERF